MGKCPGLHCDGCGHGRGGGLVLAVLAVVILGSSAAVAQAVSDLLTVVLVVAVAGVAGLAAVLAFVLRGGIGQPPPRPVGPLRRPVLPARPPVATRQVPTWAGQVPPPRRLPIEPPRPGRVLRGLVVPPSRHEAPERRKEGA